MAQKTLKSVEMMLDYLIKYKGACCTNRRQRFFCMGVKDPKYGKEALNIDECPFYGKEGACDDKIILKCSLQMKKEIIEQRRKLKWLEKLK